MKTILVATDFSDIAKNAIDYASEIACKAKAKLILFHVYHEPVFLAEIPIALPIDEIKKDCIDCLMDIKKEVLAKYGNQIVVECACRQGLPVDEINLFAKENNVDMIVMGMEGTSYLSEKIIGNITTSLLKKACCPVLAVDKHVRFKSIKNIVLASDYIETANTTTFNPLIELAEIFNSKVFILNVVRELETITTISKAVEGIKLNHTLDSINHSFHYSKSEDIIDGINDFVDEQKIDMVVMIPRAHSVLHNLLHESNCKRMAFHTKVPLLALHE